MNYGNQRDHPLLDRQELKPLLEQMAAARVSSSPVAAGRSTHLEYLLRAAGSDLERRWLLHLERHGHRLPAQAKEAVPACRCRPDFLCDGKVAVYVDGPVHEFPQRHARDVAQAECLEDRGYSVIRFPDEAAWGACLARYPNVFGAAGPQAAQ
jgi:very-short-patch-repair endonuclease